MTDHATLRVPDVVLDRSYKGMPYGVRVRLSQVPEQGWNVLAGDLAFPLLTLDREALEGNVAAMAGYCARHGTELAPHGKTTMSPQLFQRQLAAGAWGMTAATPGQVQVMRGFGVQRILLANELVDKAALRWVAEELRRDPEFEFVFLIDDPVGVQQADQVFAESSPERPVPVLIEMGHPGPGGRTGVRTRASALALADQIAGTRTLTLAGVAGYEGVVGNGSAESEIVRVDGYLAAVAELTLALHRLGRIDVSRPVVSAGGSIYFDRVVAALIPLREEIPDLRIVLRSGCYVSHDAGRYHRLSPLDGRRANRSDPLLRNALTLWGSVLSVPEPDLLIVGVGKRDAPYDVEPPLPQRLWRAASPDGEEMGGAEVVRLMDQHAYVRVDPGIRPEPGDVVSFGVSHPCAAFDRWRFVPLIDRSATVVDAITTYF